MTTLFFGYINTDTSILNSKQTIPFVKMCIRDRTYIAENGGYIISEGKELYFAHISSQDSQLIIDTLQTMPDVLCWVCTKNQSYTLKSLPEHYYQMFLPYFPHVKKVQNFSLIKEPIVKFALYLPQQNTTQRIHDLDVYKRQLLSFITNLY